MLDFGFGDVGFLAGSVEFFEKFGAGLGSHFLEVVIDGFVGGERAKLHVFWFY